MYRLSLSINVVLNISFLRSSIIVFNSTGILSSGTTVKSTSPNFFSSFDSILHPVRTLAHINIPKHIRIPVSTPFHFFTFTPPRLNYYFQMHAHNNLWPHSYTYNNVCCKLMENTFNIYNYLSYFCVCKVL